MFLLNRIKKKPVEYISQTAIVIPVYKSFDGLDETDKISLKSALNIFKSEVIVFLLPESLPELTYVEFCKSFQINPLFERFSDDFFVSKDSYSRLLVSKRFYIRFTQFKFILICQTDAFVFHNELQKWMNKGYTYIGAPWVGRTADGKVKITGAGNGGFSLRKVEDFINLTNKIYLLQFLNQLWKKNILLKHIPYGIFLRLVAAPVWIRCTINKFTFYLSEDAIQNEDRYWCEWVSEVFKDFKNAPPWLSATFAIEEEPRFLMKELGGALPMGCHAWAINDPEFWRQYIYN